MAGESPLRTLAIAAAVALVCSAMVSVAIHVLRPLQQAYALVDRNRAILDAAASLPEEISERSITSRYMDLDIRLLDISRGAFTDDVTVEDPRTYDHWSLAEDSPLLLDPEGEPEPGQPGRVPRYVPVYLLWDDGRLRRLVLPVHGPGMWSTIYGYLALTPDFRTIAAMRVYRHGETPGIGDRIEDPKWLATWEGKQICDSTGAVTFDAAKPGQSSPYQVDLISGASVTSESLADIVRFWMGPRGYGPALERLRSGALRLAPL